MPPSTLVAIFTANFSIHYFGSGRKMKLLIPNYKALSGSIAFQAKPLFSQHQTYLICWKKLEIQSAIRGLEPSYSLRVKTDVQSCRKYNHFSPLQTSVNFLLYQKAFLTDVVTLLNVPLGSDNHLNVGNPRYSSKQSNFLPKGSQNNNDGLWDD